MALCFKYAEYDAFACCACNEIVQMSMPEYRHFLTRAFFIRMEKLVLQHVHYNLQIPTLHDYVSFLIVAWKLDFSHQRALWFVALIVTQLSHDSFSRRVSLGTRLAPGTWLTLGVRLSLVIRLYRKWCVDAGVQLAKNAPFQPFDVGVHTNPWRDVSWTALPRTLRISNTKLDHLMADPRRAWRVLGGSRFIW